MKKFIALFIFTSMLSLIIISIEADFVQCPGGGVCDGTPNPDLINGVDDFDTVNGMAGDDVIFGGGGRDSLFGNENNDVIFGGPDSDNVSGNQGDDILLAGPDDNIDDQATFGHEGNDTVHVLVGETVNCYRIFSGEGFDVINLIGFGPYSAASPFGLPAVPDNSWIIIEDPIAGGLISMRVDAAGDDSVEQINGLPTPGALVVDNATKNQIENERCNLLE